MKAIFDWITANAEWLVPTLIMLLSISEGLPFIKAINADGLLHAIVEILRKTKYGALVLAAIVLTGCVTINNAALSGEKNEVKTNAKASTAADLTGNVPLQGGMASSTTNKGTAE